MPATTPNQHYPYPLDADGIDVAGDIQNLAEAVDLDVHAIDAFTDVLASRVTTLEHSPLATYANYASLPAGAPEGAMAMAPQGVVWSVVGGTWRLVAAYPGTITFTATVASGDVPPGLTVLSGSVSLPSRPVNTAWLVLWYFGLSGQSADGTFQPRNLVGGTLMAAGMTQQYKAGEPYAGFHIARFVLGAGAAGYTVEFQANIVGAGANTNINGGAWVIGTAQENLS